MPLTLEDDLYLIETLDRVVDKGIFLESAVLDAPSSALDTRGKRITVVMPPDDNDDGGGGKNPAQQMRLARRSA